MSIFSSEETASSVVNNPRIHELQERIKELECIYAISDIASNINIPFDKILQNITDRIPLGFQYPEHMCVCVTVKNKVTKTANFKICQWKFEADITAHEKVVGTLEVGYLGSMPHQSSPFQEEKKKLIQTIAARIGMVVHATILKESLEHTEKRYRDIIQNGLVGIFQTNFEGDILYANEMCLRMFGYDSLEEAMAAGSLSRYRNPEDRKNILEILKQAGKLTNFEAEFTTKTGESIFSLLSATLESDIITGMMMDITERKRANEALARSEKRLTEAQRIAHLGSWQWEIGTGALHWSEEVRRIFGLLPEEFGATYEAFLMYVHPDDRQAVQGAINQSLTRPGQPYSTEHRVILPDGSQRFVHARGEVIFDKDRRPVRMIGTIHDITARKQTEKELQKAFDEIKVLKDRLEAENVYLRSEIELKDGYGDIIGTSNPIKYVKYRIYQVAPTGATVLLTGETGTGKGVFARFLHRESPRLDKPFVNVNCAGLPPNLIESELFGREKGAFTGSTARQIGRFELANGGTIFLDEIAELPLDLQAKLLRVVEDGEFERLGSPHSVKVDVRIIASTNRNLEEEIKKGQFRKDLFYRLNVFPITIPPLRQRREDIPLLVKFYAERFSKSHRKGIQKISKRLMEILENYDWPGNVRELVNVIERAVIVSDGPELRLAERIDANPFAHQKETAGAHEEANFEGLSLVERKHILRALQETGWKVEGPRGAAQMIGMNPSTMRARMRKLGIKKPGGH